MKKCRLCRGGSAHLGLRGVAPIPEGGLSCHLGAHPYALPLCWQPLLHIKVEQIFKQFWLEEEPDCWLALGAHRLGSKPGDLQASLSQPTVHRGTRRGWLAVVWEHPQYRWRHSFSSSSVALPSVTMSFTTEEMTVFQGLDFSQYSSPGVWRGEGLKNEAYLPFLPC